jgi:CRISPR system Cascade subunit CasE
MFLSQLVLDLRHRQVRRDFADAHQLHRTVMSAFDQTADQAARREHAVLFRIDNDAGKAPLLLVQSRPEPNWGRLPSGYLLTRDHNPAVKPFTTLDQLQSGQLLRFRLTANPARKIETKTLADGKRRHGRRVELRREPEQRAWLARRAEAAGFELVQPDQTLTVTPRGKLTGRRNTARVTANAVQYDGLLRITDTNLIRQAIIAGIGPGKAYGLGLLSLSQP